MTSLPGPPVGGRHRAAGATEEPATAATEVDEALAEERGRISRDLHDLVAQRLYATGLQLRQALVPGLPDAVATRIEATLRELDVAAREMRGVVHDLRLPAGSLSERVRDLAAEYAGVLGFPPTVRTGGDPGEACEAASGGLLMALREALSNVARHADADACAIELDASPDWLMLRVVDDGVGMPVPVPRLGGLRNLRDRAEELGGVLRMRPADPHGTCLEWLVPAR